MKKQIFKIALIVIIFWIYFNKSIVKDINYIKPKSNIITLLAQKLVQIVNLESDPNNNDLAERKSNIALNYYNEWKSYSNSDEWKEKGIKTCDTSLPSIEEIDFNNIFWQTIPNTNKTQYFLYNAYYDNRGDTKYVQIVGSLFNGDWVNLSPKMRLIPELK